MEKLSDMLTMGEYGPYVWAAFGLAGAVLLVMICASSYSLRRAEKILAQAQREQ